MFEEYTEAKSPLSHVGQRLDDLAYLLTRFLIDRDHRAPQTLFVLDEVEVARSVDSAPVVLVES